MRLGSKLGSQLLRSNIYENVETKEPCRRAVMIEIKKRLQQDCTEYKPLECSQIDNIERETYLTVDEMVDRFTRSGEAYTNYIRAVRVSYEAIPEKEIEKNNNRILNSETIEEQYADMRNLDIMEAEDMRMESEKRIKNLKKQQERLQKENQEIQDSIKEQQEQEQEKTQNTTTE